MKKESDINEIINIISDTNNIFYYGSSALFKYKQIPFKIFKIITDLNLAYLGQIIPDLQYDSRLKSNCYYVSENGSVYFFLVLESNQSNYIKFLKEYYKDNCYYSLLYSPKFDKFHTIGNFNHKKIDFNLLDFTAMHLEDILDVAVIISELSLSVDPEITSSSTDNYSFSSLNILINSVLTSTNPYYSLAFLDKIGFLTILFPFLAKLKGINQDRIFHPEGDVFEHTIHCFQFVKNPSLRLSLGLLLHDYGKSFPSKKKGFGEHSTIGANFVSKLLKDYHFDQKFIKDVSFLVNYHMVNSYYFRITKDEKKIIFDSQLGLDLMKLYKADTLGSVGKLDIYQDIISDLKKDKNIKIFE